MTAARSSRACRRAPTRAPSSRSRDAWPIRSPSARRAQSLRRASVSFRERIKRDVLADRHYGDGQGAPPGSRLRRRPGHPSDRRTVRVESPSAEVQGHSPSQKKTVKGKENVAIVGIEPVGNYAIRSYSTTATTPAFIPGNIARAGDLTGSPEAANGGFTFHIAHVEIGPSPIQAKSKFSQIGPSPCKGNPRKRLGFPWISLSELSLFNDLRGPPGPENIFGSSLPVQKH